MSVTPGTGADPGRAFGSPIIEERERRMTAGLRFWWTATRGHRLRPWRSEYLKWRLETFTGKHAGEVHARDFWRFLVNERKQLFRFLGWRSEMKALAHDGTRE